MTASPKIVKTTPVFQQNLAAYQSGFPIICNEGGSRSGKTYSIIQLLCGIAMAKPKTRISIVSHSLPHIKRGAFRDFKTIMQDIGWWNEDHWRATDFVYNCPNGSYIELFGLEDEGKARGPGRDILFVNEANLVQKILFDQLAMRTTGQIFLDWNPAEFNSWVYALSDNPANKKIHSTYLDNIHNLSQNQINFIENYKNNPDDFMWKVYGLGLRGASKEIIYPNYQLYTDAPDGDVVYGLDFGFTNPAAFVKVTIHDSGIYVQELVYRSGMTTTDLATHLKQFEIGTKPIYADAAEPKSIEEVKRYGYNIHAADKDVWAGILRVKSLPLHIHSKSVNLQNEIMGYRWLKDNNDIVKEEPVKANDHLMDAMRYAVFTHLGKPKRDWIVL